MEIIQRLKSKFHVVTKYVGISITGFERVGPLQYIVTTLNANVFLIQLGYNANREIEVKEFEKLEVFVSSDEDICQVTSKMAYYGVAASKNKIFIYISSVPGQVSLNFKFF